ncbi:MAG: MmcQ/YjbR family DNA-binding protein [Actinomycetota bacterium]
MAKARRQTRDPLEALRSICMALPEVTERLSHGAPTWFVRDKSVFVTLWAEGHHANYDFPHLRCAAPPGAQAELVETEPDRFFRPPYVGGRGWLGMRLDVDVDWDEVAELCEDAYRVIAPKRLVAALDEQRGEPAQ